MRSGADQKPLASEDVRTLDRVRIATSTIGTRLVLGGSDRGIRFCLNVRIDPSTFYVEFVQILLISYGHFFAIVAAQINFAIVSPATFGPSRTHNLGVKAITSNSNLPFLHIAQ